MVKNVVQDKEKVQMCGNPALIWETKKVLVPSLKYLGEKCIAINVGTSFNCIYGEDEAYIVSNAMT